MISRTVTAVPPPTRGLQPFAAWIAKDVRPGAQVLNIGAGRNNSGALRPVLRRSPYIVGIDPDESIHDNSTVQERHQVALEDFAADNAERFDVIFSVYVLEHVADPSGFLAACGRVLRPGGVHFGLTLNVRQYFGFCTWAASRLGVAESLLRRLKDEALVAHNHHPTTYRMNSIGALSRGLDRAGFTAVEFRCYDHTDRYAWYLPKPLVGLSSLYTRAVYALDAPTLMGHLSFRAVRGADVVADPERSAGLESST